MQVHAALLLLTTAFISAGCTLLPSARDVEVHGQLLALDGSPVTGATVEFTVLKSRAFSMPGVGEHGSVRTDSSGQYKISVKKVYDALHVTAASSMCTPVEPFQATFSGDAFATGKPIAQDFMCGRGGR